jgi:hypothetical protein
MDNTRPLSSTDDPNDKSTGSDNLKTPETRQAESQGDTTQGTQPDANEELQSVITKKIRRCSKNLRFGSSQDGSSLDGSSHNDSSQDGDSRQKKSTRRQRTRRQRKTTIYKTIMWRICRVLRSNTRMTIKPTHPHTKTHHDSNSEAEHMSIVDTYDATYDTIAPV